MSPIDTAAEKNQLSGKNPGEPSDANNSIYLFDTDVKPDPAEKNHPSKKIQLISLISMIQLTYLVATLNVIPREKISHLKKKTYDPSDVNDSIDLLGNDVKPDPTEKKQPSGKNPSDPSDVNDSIDLFGNDVEPDHNLKISSTHATNDVDNPGKNQSKRKIPRCNSKATLEDVVGNKG
jgi:hypothetical protein